MNILLLLTVFLLPLLGTYQGFGYEQIKVLFFLKVSSSDIKLETYAMVLARSAV